MDQTQCYGYRDGGMEPGRVYIRRPYERPRKLREWLWRDGKQFFQVAELGRRRRITYAAAWQWAHRRPELTMLYNNHLYCRDEPGWPARNRPSLPPNPRAHLHPIERDGLTYYPLPALARRRGTTTVSASSWVRARPELTIVHGGHVYCRDERAWPLKPSPGRRPTRYNRIVKEMEQFNEWRRRRNEILYPPW